MLLPRSAVVCRKSLHFVKFAQSLASGRVEIHMCRVGRKQPGVSLGLSLLFLLSAFSTAFAQQTQPAGVPTCTSTSVTLSNQNPYPIWIGENVSTGSILFPGNAANWELDSGVSKSVCIPADWTSGFSGHAPNATSQARSGRT